MSYTYSTPGTLTYSVTFDNLDQMMSVLPDNDQNLISARDLRDSILTLWYQSASFSATGSTFTYTNNDPTTISVGGIPIGTTFSDKSLQDLFTDMFNPYVTPLASLNASNANREFGSANTTVLNWSVVRKKLAITSIDVNGISVVPTGNSQSGTSTTITFTQNLNSTFTMSVSDSVSTILATTSVTWFDAVYWGKTPTFATPSMTIVGTQPGWADGAGVGSGKSLTSSFIRSWDGIDGAGQYLVFSWPESFGTPTFLTNGMVNTAFTNFGTVSFSNMWGYNNVYDIWISNSVQNSPITKFEII